MMIVFVLMFTHMTIKIVFAVENLSTMGTNILFPVIFSSPVLKKLAQFGKICPTLFALIRRHLQCLKPEMRHSICNEK